jgi:hypothetical protein
LFLFSRMRYIWMTFGGLLVAMLALLPRLRHPSAPATVSGQVPVQQASYSPAALGPAGRTDLAKADSIVAFGLAQRGTPYVWAGTSPLTGFDCSGFIMYTFAHFGVPVPHSTAMLIDVGRPVARAEAQPGDIVVFTGTDPASTTPGHAGIIISRRGELPLRFVHASSSRREPFVKVSQVENSDYERRFMQVRRVLGPATGIATIARAKAPAATPAAAARTAVPISALPTRAVAVAEKAVLGAPLPKVLPKRPTSRNAVAHRKVAVAYKPASKAKLVRKAKAKPVAKPKAKTKAPAKKTLTKPTSKARSTNLKAASAKKKHTSTR